MIYEKLKLINKLQNIYYPKNANKCIQKILEKNYLMAFVLKKLNIGTKGKSRNNYPQNNMCRFNVFCYLVRLATFFK